VADKIPLVDLKAQYRTIQAEVDRAVLDVLAAQFFVLGPHVEKFERDFAAYCGAKHCVGVQSGTSALMLMLQGLGIGPGDEVITTPLTFFATSEAILLCGATPVYADVDPATLNLDPKKAAAAVTKKTKALMPVHLYGQPADMAALASLARDKGLILLEDAAQAAGSSLDGRKAGSLARAASFSFYPGKNLGCYGEGGAITTDDDALAETLKGLRAHGSPKKNWHPILGGNYRLEAIQGAVLNVKLPRLDAWNDARRRLAARYREKLAGAQGLSFVEERAPARSNYHLFVVRHARRDALLSHLRERGIEADIHYPVASHLQPAAGPAARPEGSFPDAEKAIAEIVSLPLFPEMTDAQQDRVCDAVRQFRG
jgi:dTDP-4-amino-4,6-dideoxygalactose transaminase